MEQIYSNIMQMTQSIVERQTPASAKQSEEGASFRDLMKEKQTSEPKEQAVSGESQAEAKGEQAEVAESPAQEEEVNLEAKMMLAAMAMMQNPVVSVEQPVMQEAGAIVQSVMQTDVVAQAEGMVQAAADAQVSGEAGEAAVELLQADTNVQSEEVLSDVTDVQTEQTSAGDMEQAGDEWDLTQTTEDTGAETAVFRNVDEIPVKVGEVESPEMEKLSASVKEQVSQQLSKALQEGDTRITIQLDPHHLGKVNVEMTLTKDGALHVELRAENSLTQHLLEREAMGLQNVLNRETQQDVQVEVPRQQESQQQNFEDGRQGRNQQEPEQQRQEESGQDFLQQLRLGLIPQQEEEN